jgi:molecular chaperone IbpA
MATPYDYTPLYRSSVGFDRVFNPPENAQRCSFVSRLHPALHFVATLPRC